MGHRIVKIEPNLVCCIPCVSRVSNRNNFGYSWSLERDTFSYVNSRLIRIINFENWTFSKGQKVVRIEPNLVCSILCVSRVSNRNNFGYSWSLERDTFSYVNSRLIRIINFENWTFSKGQKVVRIEPNLVCRIPCVCRV